MIDQRDHNRLAVDNAVRGDVAGAVTQVRSVLRQQLSDALSTQSQQRVIPAARLAGSAVSVQGAITARDSGTAVLDDTARPPSIIAPIYRGAAPASTSARRQAIVGYRVVPLQLTDALELLVPNSGGLAVRGPQRLIATVPGRPGAGTQRFAVQMDPVNLPGWQVEGWLPGGGIPGGVWYAVAAMLIVAGLTAWLLIGLLRRLDAARERERRLERDRALVTGLAPVLQASLDMGDVVPAVATHLAEGLQLAGLSITQPCATGERPLFVWGDHPSLDVTPTPIVPAELKAGETAALSLARGGRLLGSLRVVAGRDLSHGDLSSLATCGELFGSTLANAEAFAQQQELVDRMRSVDELKTVFLSTASHELRTPVTALVGFSKLLLDGWGTLSNERSRALMERVNSNARRLDGLIEQLLDFSRLERGLSLVEGELLDVGAATSEMLANQPELVGGHNLRVEVDDACVIRGSGPALERIVTNLVSNAAKYSPAGTLITVRVERERDRVLLIVDDEGAGVPAADRERVFSRFFRGRGDTVARTRGAGVGLAIVSEYAASMSGVASVTEAPSGGARFQVSFPAAASPTPAAFAAPALARGGADARS
ncbi:ATP-binding protein [uncultured Jatrophihabitans sp.]|uniref:ATP-binding protein n=1 Tax=uncultured Jatrophihabitans sp. TaxID=1610747 RepID=UPI0035CA6BD2